MAIAYFAIPKKLLMKKIIIPALAVLAACSEKSKEVYYPRYAISVEVTSSNKPFVYDGLTTNYFGVRSLLNEKKTGDKVIVNLGSAQGFDTTYFGVTYRANDNVVKFDTGYSVMNSGYTSSWDVK